MRFTIRHLLWFTLLAAVGCWWWMPSGNDPQRTAANALGDSEWHIVQKKLEQPDTFHVIVRFDAPAPHTADVVAGLDLRSGGPTATFDFANHDVLLYNFNDFSGDCLTVRGRGRGLFVLATIEPDRSAPVEGEIKGVDLFSISKQAQILYVSRTQADWIDVGVTVGLVVLAFGSLFVGRKRPSQS